ncbi:autotransporter outer membrane beta-barrel domain-containing protein, partial [uncultured Sutterella sp.]
NLLFKNKIGESSLDIHRSETKIKVSGGNRVFGVRSSGSQSEINFTGNEASVEVKSERGQAYGLIIENGGYVNFAGNIATIEAESNTNSAYGVSSENGSHANFAGNAEIIASTHGSDRNAYGIHIDSGNAAFGKSLTVSAIAEKANSYGIFTESKSTTAASKEEGLFSAAGPTVIIVVAESADSSKPREAAGIVADGDQASMTFGDAVFIQAESQNSIAAGVRSQNGGRTNFAGDAVIISSAHGSGNAYGVQIDGSGHATFGKSLIISAEAEDANAFGIAADGDLARMTFGNASVHARSEAGTSRGIAAVNKGTIHLTGDIHSIVAEGPNSIGLLAENSGQMVLSGRTMATGDSMGVKIDKTSSLSLTGQALLSTNTIDSKGTINLAEDAVLIVEGAAGGSSILNKVAAEGATVAVGAGDFSLAALQGRGNTLFVPVLKATDSVAIDSASFLRVASTGSSSDEYANAREALNALQTKVRIKEGTDNVYEIEEGTVNDGIVAVQNDDGTWSTTIRENQKLARFRSVNALSVLAWRHEMNSLSKRMGELRDSPAGVGSWVRLYGSEQEYGAKSVKNKSTTIQVGSDVSVGDWRVGLAGSYTDGQAAYDLGEADTDNYGISLYGTWLIPCGAHVDLIARFNRLENDFELNGMKGSYSNNAWSFNAETGYKFAFAEERFFAEPQIGLSYGRVEGARFRTENGMEVDQSDVRALIGRAGIRTGMSFPEKKGTIYARVSVVHDFEGDLTTTYRYGAVSRNASEDDFGGTWMEYGLGANFSLTESTYVYADLERNDGGKVKENWRWNIGLRHAW